MATTKGMVYVGIDVSKEKFDVCCVDEGGEKKFGSTFPMDSDGFKLFLRKLGAVAGRKKSVLIGMESTVHGVRSCILHKSCKYGTNKSWPGH